MGKRVRLEGKAAAKVAATEPKKDKVKLDPLYLRKLCLEVYRIRMDEDDPAGTRGGETASERVLSEYVKKYKGDRVKAEARFEEHAQIYAPIIRVALRVLHDFGDLPKGAEG
jgi:hypothetical protein